MSENFLKEFMKPFVQDLAQKQERWKKLQIENQKRALEKEQEAQRKAAKQAEEAAKKAEEAARCDLMREHIMQFKNQRANTVRSTETGSAEYLKARYGDYAYRSMLSVAVRELTYSEEKAAAFLTENYSEAMWKNWEDDDIERILGNR